MIVWISFLLDMKYKCMKMKYAQGNHAFTYHMAMNITEPME